jgi:bacillithiol biosynthesis deacetylase BshB1
MKVDILAFGAHPDDIELGCGGLIVSEVKQGKKVGLVDLTAGEMGSRGTASIRSDEAKKAAQILGASFRINLDLGDAKFQINEDSLSKIVHLIRIHQPDVVLINAPNDRHPDHGRAAKLVADACFLSGLVKWQYHGIHENVWRPRSIYHYMQFYHLKPDFIYDISEVIEEKIDSIKAHKSQFWDPNSLEPETLIASKQFFDSIKYRAAEFGFQAGFEYGEPLITLRVAGVKDIHSLY